MSTKLKRSPVTFSAFKRTSNISLNMFMPSPHHLVMQQILALTQDFRSRGGGGGVRGVVVAVFRQRVLQAEIMQLEENYEPT